MVGVFEFWRNCRSSFTTALESLKSMSWMCIFSHHQTTVEERRNHSNEGNISHLSPLHVGGPDHVPVISFSWLQMYRAHHLRPKNTDPHWELPDQRQLWEVLLLRAGLLRLPWCQDLLKSSWTQVLLPGLQWPCCSSCCRRRDSLLIDKKPSKQWLWQPFRFEINQISSAL